MEEFFDAVQELKDFLDNAEFRAVLSDRENAVINEIMSRLIPSDEKILELSKAELFKTFGIQMYSMASEFNDYLRQLEDLENK